jgi:hypothetical protein
LLCGKVSSRGVAHARNTVENWQLEMKVTFEAVKEQLHILGHDVPDSAIFAYLRELKLGEPRSEVRPEARNAQALDAWDADGENCRNVAQYDNYNRNRSSGNEAHQVGASRVRTACKPASRTR